MQNTPATAAAAAALSRIRKSLAVFVYVRVDAQMGRGTDERTRPQPTNQPCIAQAVGKAPPRFHYTPYTVGRKKTAQQPFHLKVLTKFTSNRTVAAPAFCESGGQGGQNIGDTFSLRTLIILFPSLHLDFHPVFYMVLKA